MPHVAEITQTICKSPLLIVGDHLGSALQVELFDIYQIGMMENGLYKQFADTLVSICLINDHIIDLRFEDTVCQDTGKSQQLPGIIFHTDKDTGVSEHDLDLFWAPVACPPLLTVQPVKCIYLRFIEGIDNICFHLNKLPCIRNYNRKEVIFSLFKAVIFRVQPGIIRGEKAF